MDPDTLIINKSSESPVRVLLHRDSAGLSVTVRAHPRVEEFMRNFAHGETVNVETVGRYWASVSKGRPLLAYSTPKMDLSTAKDGSIFTLDKIGQPLTEDSRDYGQVVVNISFLKLVGVSDPGGTTFKVKGNVFSTGGLRKIRDQIAFCNERFYNEYVRPLDLSTTLVTGAINQEMVF